jgi:hypothetical protein
MTDKDNDVSLKQLKAIEQALRVAARDLYNDIRYDPNILTLEQYEELMEQIKRLIEKEERK